MSKQNAKIAARYAAALLRSVKEQQLDAQQLAVELFRFAQQWTDSSELSTSLQNPLFSKEQRAKSLQVIAQHLGLAEVLQRFLAVVFEHERIAAIVEIAEAYSASVQEAAGIVQVRVRVAREVASEEQSSIEASLSEQIKGTAEYSWSIDPSLLGGIVVEYDGHVLDGSVSGRLDRLERELLG